MYDVTPEVRGHWHALLRIAAEDAGVALECIDHAAPAPLEALWNRDDLGAAFMCGLPLATLYPAVRPLAAPLTRARERRIADVSLRVARPGEQRIRYVARDVRPSRRLDRRSLALGLQRAASRASRPSDEGTPAIVSRVRRSARPSARGAPGACRESHRCRRAGRVLVVAARAL